MLRMFWLIWIDFIQVMIHFDTTTLSITNSDKITKFERCNDKSSPKGYFRQKTTRSLGFCSRIESGHNLGCHTRLQGPDMGRPENYIFIVCQIFLLFFIYVLPQYYCNRRWTLVEGFLISLWTVWGRPRKTWRCNCHNHRCMCDCRIDHT